MQLFPRPQWKIPLLLTAFSAHLHNKCVQTSYWYWKSPTEHHRLWDSQSERLQKKMDESNPQWKKIRDRLQMLSDMLFWQWAMRLAARRDGTASLIKCAEWCGGRTTRYIRYLRRVMGWVPYVVESRSTVVCPALQIRCLPGRRNRGRSTNLPAEPEPEWLPQRPSGWYPDEPPKPDSQEEGKPCGGRFLD